MKKIKRAGIAVVVLPIALILLYVLYEIFGMCVNHISTDRQTSRLEKALTTAVSDIEVKNVYSWTGNTGNGNHVECVSEITFSSDMKGSDIISSMSEEKEWNIKERNETETGIVHLRIDGKRTAYVTLSPKDDGDYLFRMVVSAPFSDNIEGR